MSLFSQHFHWKSIVNWPTGAFSLLLGIATWMRLSDHGLLALLFLGAAALLGIGKVVDMAWSAPERSLWDRIAFTVVCGAGVVGLAWAVMTGLGSGRLLPQPTGAVTAVERRSDGAPAPVVGESDKQNNATPPPAISSRQRREDTRTLVPSTPKADTEPAAVAVTAESGRAIPENPAGSMAVPPDVFRMPPSNCQAEVPDKPPNVKLERGDVVVVSASNLFRVRQKQSTRILSSEFLAEARAVAVEANGNVLVGTRACGEGLLVRINPRTGIQMPIVSGFRVPESLLIEPGGQTVLVGDENSGRYGGQTGGALVQVDLTTRMSKVLHTFRSSDVATGIARDPNTGDIYFAARGLYRMPNAQSPARHVDVEGIDNARAVVITPQGTMYIADSGLGGVLSEVDFTAMKAKQVLGNQDGFTGGWIGLASTLDGHSLVVGSSKGLVTEFAVVPPAAAAPVELWSGAPGGPASS